MQQILRRKPTPLSAAVTTAAFSCLFGSVAPAAEAQPLPAPWSAVPAPLLPTRSPVDGGSTWTLRAVASNFEAADATPVRQLDGDWARYTPRAGRNAALQSARLEVAAARQGWEVAAVLRGDIHISGSRGAWDTVHAYRQRLTPADGTAFEVDAQQTGLVWAGLRGARSWALRAAPGHTLQLTGAVTALSLQRVQTVDARGRVGYTSATGYSFDAATLRQDSHRQFGGYGRQDTTGRGITADLGLWWQPSSGSYLNLAVVDALARLRIGAVSTEQATASSATLSLDPQGYLAYQPVLVGRYTAQDLRPRPAPQWTASAGTAVAVSGREVLLGVRWEHTRGLDLPAAWAVLPLLPGLALQLDAETRFRSIGIGLAARHASLMLRTRSLPVSGSHALGWQAAVNWPL